MRTQGWQRSRRVLGSGLLIGVFARVLPTPIHGASRSVTRGGHKCLNIKGAGLVCDDAWLRWVALVHIHVAISRGDRYVGVGVDDL